MTTIGKDFPVRSDAFRFSSEKRASSAATSPALTECFDIFSPEPGDSDVISQMERLSSRDVKMQARWVWIAMGASDGDRRQRRGTLPDGARRGAYDDRGRLGADRQHLDEPRDDAAARLLALWAVESGARIRDDHLGAGFFRHGGDGQRAPAGRRDA